MKERHWYTNLYPLLKMSLTLQFYCWKLDMTLSNGSVCGSYLCVARSVWFKLGTIGVIVALYVTTLHCGHCFIADQADRFCAFLRQNLLSLQSSLNAQFALSTFLFFVCKLFFTLSIGLRLFQLY